jgi:hypothetical protein
VGLPTQDGGRNGGPFDDISAVSFLDAEQEVLLRRVLEALIVDSVDFEGRYFCNQRPPSRLL